MWNVLIVEDDPKDAKQLMDGLTHRCKCHLIDNGSEALDIYKSSFEKGPRFDFILLDVQLPNKNGFDVLKSIRKLEEAYLNESTPESNIIMVTTYKDSLMSNYNMGWDDFISKPIDPAILLERFAEIEAQKQNTP